MGLSSLTIAHVLAPSHVGGLERVVQGLAIGHRARGHDVHVAAVVTPGSDAEAFASRLRESDVSVQILRLPTRGYLKERRMVRRWLRQLHPSVVHTHGYRPDVVDAPVARKLGIPVVTTVHGASFMGGRSSISEWLQERSYRRFDAVIAVSKPLEEDLLRGGVEIRKIHMIPNGWDGSDDAFWSRERARTELGLEANAFVVGWVGRMIKVKGGDVLLRALAQLDGEWVASVIGDGPERPILDDLAEQLSISGRVRFHGGIKDARRFFRAFDVFVLSSRSEGTPIVLFEAMAAGVPVVATDVGGVSDVLGTDAGLVVDSTDALQIAGSIRQLRADSQRAARLARSARTRLDDKFGSDRWLAAHEDIYAQVVAQDSR